MKLDIEEVIDDFMTNTEEYTGDSVLVGERPEFGISVFVEGVVSSDGAVYPEVSVWADNTLAHCETVYSKEDFRDCLCEISDTYLGSASVALEALSHDCAAEDEDEDEICVREEELDSAVRDFLHTVYRCDPFEGAPDEDETFEEVKDQLLGVLADFDGDIYRPMEIDGVVVEYPYAAT